jgi:hypothetical protein
MKSLEYDWVDGTHTTFDGYTIDEHSVVRNKKGHVMTPLKSGKYNNIGVRHEGIKRNILVGRALASTFLGNPPTLQHTADHKDKNSINDVLSNIRWLDKSGQRLNQTRSMQLTTAYVIVKDGVEHTANEWIDIFKKPNGKQYTTQRIHQFAQQQINGFRYKVFPELRAEVWKAVPDSKNSQGEWFISNMNRMKYKTAHADNVLTVDQLNKQGGYPSIKINGKQWQCHHLSMMTFRPREYAAKLPGDIILHKNDDPLDFNPFRLRWGTPSENGKDAHNNRKYDGTKSAQKPVASYIDGVFEREHESIEASAKYLKNNGYSKACRAGVQCALKNNVTRYDRTWVLISP